MSTTTSFYPRRLLRLFLPLALLAVGTAAFRSPPDDDVVRRIVLGVQRFYGAMLPEKRICTSTSLGTPPVKPSG